MEFASKIEELKYFSSLKNPVAKEYQSGISRILPKIEQGQSS